MWKSISNREKGMVILAGLAIVGTVLYFGLIEPYQEERAAEEELLAEEEYALEEYRFDWERRNLIQQEAQALTLALRKARPFHHKGDRMTVQNNLLQALPALAPDLALRVRPVSTSVRNKDRLNLKIHGQATYPVVLEFLKRLEGLDPLIYVDQCSLTARPSRKSKGGQVQEPRVQLSMLLHVRLAKEGGI